MLKTLTLAAQIGITAIVLLVVTWAYIDRRAEKAIKKAPEYLRNPELDPRGNASFAIGCWLLAIAGAVALIGLFFGSDSITFLPVRQIARSQLKQFPDPVAFRHAGRRDGRLGPSVDVHTIQLDFMGDRLRGSLGQ